MKSLSERRADNNAFYIKKAYLTVGEPSTIFQMLQHFTSKESASIYDAISDEAHRQRFVASTLIEKQFARATHWFVARLGRAYPHGIFIRDDGLLVHGPLAGSSYLPNATTIRQDVESIDSLHTMSVIEGLNRLMRH